MSLNSLCVHLLCCILAVELLLHREIIAVCPNNFKCDIPETSSLQTRSACKSLFQACVSVILTALKTPGVGPVKQEKASRLLQQGLDPISKAGCISSRFIPVLFPSSEQSPGRFPTPEPPVLTPTATQPPLAFNSWD